MPSEQTAAVDRRQGTGTGATRFGGNYKAAFVHYDADGSGDIYKNELKALLSDAGIGNVLTRWAGASGILSEVDRDRAISWAEFETVFEGKKS